MATERMQVVIETQTRGSEAVDKLRVGIERLGEVSVSVAKKTAEAVAATGNALASAGRGIVSFAREHEVLTAFVARSTVQLIRHRDALRNVVDGYRAGRLILSPGLFTVGTLGASVAAEAALRTALTRARLLEQEAVAAAAAGRGAATGRIIGAAGRISGADLSGLLGSKLSSTEIREAADELRRIEDPVERVRRATELFGKDASVALGLFRLGTSENIRRAQELAFAIDGPTRESIGRFKRDVDGISATFTVLGDKFRELAEQGRQGITIAVSATFDVVRNAGKGSGFGLTGAGDLGPQFIQEPITGRIPSAAELAVQANDLAQQGLQRIAPRFRNAAGLAAASATNRTFSSSLEGVQAELGTARKRRDALRELVQLGGQQADLAAQELVNASRSVDTLGRRLELLEREDRFRKKFAEFQFIPENDKRGPNRRTPSLFRRGEGAFFTGPFEQAAGSLTISNADINAANVGANTAIAGQGRAILDAENSKQQRSRERLLEIARSETDFQARRVALIVGPGGEVAAVERVAAIRLAALERQRELGEEGFKLEQERSEILRTRELQLLEIQKRRLDEIRDSAGKVFDALIAGGSGIRGFVSGLGLTTGRTIFQNFAQIALGTSSGRFSLPGTGTADSPSLLGRILSGTPFGPKFDPQKQALDANTLATNANTAALLGRGGSGLSSIAPFGSRTLASIFGGVASAVGGSGGNPTLANLPPGASVLLPNAAGIPTVTNPNRFTFAQGVGIAGTAAASFFGARAGFQQGGAQGALTASSSILGGAAGILALAGVSGPAAPIIGAVALGAGIAGALLGDPKKRRGEEIERTIRDRQFIDPIGIERIEDRSGSGLDIDRFGRFRSGAPTLIINQNFDMLDGRQIIDRRADFIDAMHQGIVEGGADALLDDIGRRLLPQ